jgi:hypothetical protein
MGLVSPLGDLSVISCLGRFLDNRQGQLESDDKVVQTYLP